MNSLKVSHCQKEKPSNVPQMSDTFFTPALKCVAKHDFRDRPSKLNMGITAFPGALVFTQRMLSIKEGKPGFSCMTSGQKSMGIPGNLGPNMAKPPKVRMAFTCYRHQITTKCDGYWAPVWGIPTYSHAFMGTLYEPTIQYPLGP